MPHNTSTDDTSLPPFPDGLNEAPIQIISLSSLLSSDPTTISALNTAVRTHGFFYLDLSNCAYGKALLSSSVALHTLSKRAFALPDGTKWGCAVGSPACRSIFGYKAAGIIANDDPHKRRDVGEMWNVSKDDMLGLYTKPCPYPEMIRKERDTFEKFDRTAHEVGMVVLDVLADSLGIERKELRSRHDITHQSGDHTRLTFGPGDPNTTGPTSTTDNADTKITTYAHTDFGSITLLFNWLGGLQIESQEPDSTTGQKEWQWVRPLPGHAICNLGDSMVTFSGERLKSGRHRVVAAPGDQAKFDRYSLVYFVRPEDNVHLVDLTVPAGKARNKEAQYTAKQWIEMKARNLGNAVKNDESTHSLD